MGEVGELLIDQLEARGRKRSTVGEYRSYLRVHLGPFFGATALDEVTVGAVEAFIAAKRREGKATKSILNYLGLLHSVFEFGCRRGFARTNIAKLVEKPERDGAGSDIRFLDETELEALMRAVPEDVRGPSERVLCLTAAMTGLRQGELLGLRWQDIDWIAGRVRVRQNFVRGEFGTPKTRRSSRSVPLAQRAAAALERHFQASAYQGDQDLVFCHPQTGTPLDRSRLLKRFKAAARRGGLRPVRFHDLRHTFGTRMAGTGVPMRKPTGTQPTRTALQGCIQPPMTLATWLWSRRSRVRVPSLTPQKAPQERLTVLVPPRSECIQGANGVANLVRGRGSWRVWHMP